MPLLHSCPPNNSSFSIPDLASSAVTQLRVTSNFLHPTIFHNQDLVMCHTQEVGQRGEEKIHLHNNVPPSHHVMMIKLVGRRRQIASGERQRKRKSIHFSTSSLEKCPDAESASLPCSPSLTEDTSVLNVLIKKGKCLFYTEPHIWKAMCFPLHVFICLEIESRGVQWKACGHTVKSLFSSN